MWRMDIWSGLTPDSVTVKAVGHHHHTAQFPLGIKTQLEKPNVQREAEWTVAVLVTNSINGMCSALYQRCLQLIPLFM